jgi:uncharacterized protein (DUF924 family)
MTSHPDQTRILDFWFPDDGHWDSLEAHQAFWQYRMRGDVDDAVCRDFADVTEAAARGQHDDWADTPRGRLALLIALDQFPRSLWRGTPAAYAQDIKATRLVLEALENGHYDALPHTWERQFYIIALTHCEGPDHLARMDLAIRLSKAQKDIGRPALLPMADRPVEQAVRVRGVIERFGRHPHRNAVYGRVSTTAEDAYITEGDFPHERKIELPGQNAG